MTRKMLPNLLNLLNRLFLTLTALAAAPAAFAQTPAAAPAVEMADTLRHDGKIWVVAVVFAIVTLGTLLYLFRLESKLTKLEKRMKAEKGENRVSQ